MVSYTINPNAVPMRRVSAALLMNHTFFSAHYLNSASLPP